MSDIYPKSGKPSDGDFFTETKFETSPLPKQMETARLNHADNLERQVFEAVASVRIATPERDASPNSRLRYERNYERMRQAVRQFVLASDKSVAVPSYLPPPTRFEKCTVMTAADFPETSAYEERGGRGKSTGVQPNFADVTSDAHQNWLTSQGVPPVDTTGLSPADAGKARRARAGVKS